MSAEILINEKVNLNDQFQLISIKILETMKITEIINKYDILQYFNWKTEMKKCKKSLKKLWRMLCWTELDNSPHMLNMKW